MNKYALRLGLLFNLFACLLMISSASAQDAFEPLKKSMADLRASDLYFPEQVKLEKWGFLDQNGKLVIDVQFDNICPYFSEGLAAVESNKKWGFIDKSGNYAIPPKFEAACNFSEGLAFVKNGAKFGVIDKTGNYVIEPKFEELGEAIVLYREFLPDRIGFSEGLAPVRLNGKYGFVDRKGQMRIKEQYDHAVSFDCGMAPVKKNGKWGLIDKTGKLLLETEYDFILPSNQGIMPVSKEKKWGFVSSTGKLIASDLPVPGGYFQEGLVAASKNGKQWGYIDLAGEYVIKPEYEQLAPFSEGLAGVKRGGKWGFIDKKGNIVIKPVYMQVGDFSEGLVSVRDENGWSFIDKNGKKALVLGNEYFWRPCSKKVNRIVAHTVWGPYFEGLTFICKYGKWCYFDKKGKAVIDLLVSEPGQFYGDNLAPVVAAGDTLSLKSEQKPALVDKSGSLIKLDSISSISPELRLGKDAKFHRFSEGLIAAASAKPVAEYYVLARSSLDRLAYISNLKQEKISVLNEAKGFLEQALRIDSQFASAYAYRGRISLFLEDYKAAINDFSKTISLAPDCARAYAERSLAYEKVSEPEKSAGDLQTAVKIKPDLASRFLQNAKDFVGAKNLDALHEITLCLKLNPDLAEAYSVKGHAELNLGDFDSALADCNKSIELKKSPEAYKQRARVYFSLRKYTEAIEDFSKAIKFEPDNSLIFEERARCYFDKKDYENAKNDLLKVIDLDPAKKSELELQMALIECYYQLKDYQSVVNHLPGEIDPTVLNRIGSDCLLKRADAYFHLGDWTRAARDLKQYLIRQVQLHFIPGALYLTLALVVLKEVVGLFGPQGLLARKAGKRVFFRIYALSVITLACWALAIILLRDLGSSSVLQETGVFLLLLAASIISFSFSFRKPCTKPKLFAWLTAIYAGGVLLIFLASLGLDLTGKLIVGLIFLPALYAGILYSRGKMNGGEESDS